MSEQVNEASDVTAAGATMLASGFVTSALFLVAASILWVGFLIAASVGGLNKPADGQGFTLGVITLLNAAMFYVWGIYGLSRSRKALRAALARRPSGQGRT